MSLDSNSQSKKRYLSDDSEQQDNNKIPSSSPRKKVKRHKEQSQQQQQQNRSTSSTDKHKKRKKSKSKSKIKKHKQKSQKKHKKHKNKQKKQKKKKQKKNKKNSDKQSSQSQSSSDLELQEDDSQLQHIVDKLKKKNKKAKNASKSKQKPVKSNVKLSSNHTKKVKNQPIVSASEDQNVPISILSEQDHLDQQGNSNIQEQNTNNNNSSIKQQKKKRGRKPKSQSIATQSKPFQIDDFINLDGEQNGQQQQNQLSKLHPSQSLARISKKKIDRLTKIKNPPIKNIIVTKNVENVPVDHNFSRFNQCHVLQISGCFYNATLTQSNIVRDDNKFFIIQILQMNHNQQQFYVYSRWGRVGVTGQISQLGPLNKQASIRHYNQVVQNKIKIGHYKVVQMNYDDYDTNKKEKGNKQLQISSKLDLKVQQLIKLIFDIKMMNSHMKQIGYDEKRLPLGKLASKSITEGYNALNKLLMVINNKDKQTFEKRKQINQLSGIFYQCIPHDFGYMNMQTFVLDTQQKVKQKLQILSSLQQIQIYTNLLNEKFNNPQLNQIDQKYYRLNLKITPLVKGSQVWKKLIRYVQNTHAKTHNKYDLQVQDIFQLRRQQDQINYRNQLGNKMLLWHGSRLTNYVGILSKGLKIAPLQAPSTGYMFGKGIYFADMVSKSANYCLASKINNVGLVLLCEVALGNMQEKWNADFSAANLPEGKNSTKGMGHTEPMGGEMLDGVWVPNGKASPSGVVDSTLLYNEYVVYDPRQIKYRYLFRFKFHFKVTENILPNIRITS